MIKKIKKGLQLLRRVRKIHNLKAVCGLCLTKISPLSQIIRSIFGTILIKTKILDSIMYLDIFDMGLHRKLLVKGIREPEHVNQIRENLKRGMVGIDIGANIGYFALYTARLVCESGFIYCIEPEPRNLKILIKNIKANQLENRTKTFQCLVGDRNGLEKLYISEFANVHSLSPHHPTNTGDFIEIPMITLDTFLEKNNLKPSSIDFIRMDIEGYEVRAFCGMENMLKANSSLKIFMEFHPAYYPEWGWTFEELLKYLDSFGIKIREIAKGREFNERGELKPIILKNPTIEEVLIMQKNTQGDGSQAFLEKII